MKPKSYLLVIAALLLMSLILAACGGNEETTVPEENPVVTQDITPSDEVTESPDNEKSEVPVDVPIVPDAYDLQVPDQLNLSYKIDKNIEEVVTYYQQEFENYGWNVVKNPDSVVGNMAQLSRSNEAGDRLIFSLQFNPIGEFTIVQISITRVP